MSELKAIQSAPKKNVVGIAGTAKNTGKTTTLNCLLKEAAHQKIPVGITGIGYDGEETDNITFLPKPRITVYPGTIVTTSERCLEISTAEVEILYRTGMYTALGEILILRVIRAGLIVIAGPGKRKDLQIVIAKMEQFEIDGIFVDGSLNRIAPMSVVDSIIFTTGGARSTDIEILCEEMHAIESLFRLPVYPFIHQSKQDLIEIPLLLEAGDVETLISECLQKNKTVYISQMISPVALATLTEFIINKTHSIQNIIFSDPFMFLMNDNIVQTYQSICTLKKSHIPISYRRLPELKYLTANPFFPQLTGNKYSAHFLNNDELMTRLRSSCSIPVFNTRETDGSILLRACVK